MASAFAELARAGGRAYVVKPYSEFMPSATHDARIREVLSGADLCLANGVGILWVAHYQALPGGPLRALAQLSLSLAAIVFNPAAIRRPLKGEHGWRGPDLGDAGPYGRGRLANLPAGGHGGGGVGRERADRSAVRRVAGTYSGHFDSSGEENETVLRAINEAQPEVLLVAMGFPRQENWIAANLPRLQVNVAVAEGGSFSFISGLTPRAPRWLRRLGLEWLYRLARQPWRLHRQLAIPRFVWLVVRERLRKETYRKKSV